MSKFAKNPSSLKNVQNAGAPAAPSVVVTPVNKQPRLARGESEGKTQLSSSTSEAANLSHPQKKATPTPLHQEAKTQSLATSEEASETTSSTGTSTRAPRDPHGHKLVKVSEVFESSHKTKYLPLGDGQYTFAMYLQPFAMKECGKNWCEVEMLELVNGTSTLTSRRIYSIDAEDLLKMCYLHAMANLDLAAESRLHYEQWVLSVFQEYCASYGSADYTDRGAIARCYMDKIGYSFKIGAESSRLEMFFQKRCIRDLGSIDDRVLTTTPVDNLNVVQGKSAKSKFEYQIEGYIMCVPGGAGTKQRRDETEQKEMEEEEEEC